MTPPQAAMVASALVTAIASLGTTEQYQVIVVPQPDGSYRVKLALGEPVSAAAVSSFATANGVTANVTNIEFV